MSVAEEFSNFRHRYNIGTDLIISIGQRYRRITLRLNRDFWGTESDTAHSLYVGSYGRDTAAKGISDLDVGFRLPYALFEKYNNYTSNGQSALLQSVRNSLLETYPNTIIGGDGQVVTIFFADGVRFEILPYFDGQNGEWVYADTNNGGSWKACNPRAEISAVHERNIAVNHNLKALCRMMRVWRDNNNVNMSGALIDTLAYQFIASWGHRDKSFAYHDYMARDFLKYLYELDREKIFWRMPGSGSPVYKKGEFWYKAKIDYDIAVKACLLQKDSEEVPRRAYWRSVFGPTFPV